MLRIAVPIHFNSYFRLSPPWSWGSLNKKGSMLGGLAVPVPKTFEALRDGQLDFVVGSAHATLRLFLTGRAKLLCTIGQPILVLGDSQRSKPAHGI